MKKLTWYVTSIHALFFLSLVSWTLTLIFDPRDHFVRSSEPTPVQIGMGIVTLVMAIGVVASWPFLPGVARHHRVANLSLFEKSNRVTANFMASVFVLLVCLLMASAVHKQIRGAVFKRNSLVATSGFITLSHVEYLRKSGRSPAYYAPRLAYKYWYRGQPYTSRLIDFSLQRSFADLAEAEAIVAANPVGKRVQVFVEDGNPFLAVLYPERRYLTIPLFVILSFVGLCAVWGIARSVLQLRQCLLGD